MAEYTTYYNLIKPDDDENYDIEVANTNNTKIDQVLKEKFDANDISDYYNKTQINSLLSNNITTLTSPARIWELDDGIYNIPNNSVIYYDGQSGTSNSITTVSDGWMMIVSNGNYKQFFIFHGNGENHYLSSGSTTSSAGVCKTVNLYYKIITANDVIDSLTYSTASQEYVLSAYQGYLLNKKVLASGKSITMSIDPTTYVLTINLLDANSNILSTQTVDLPLETMVVNASYDETNKKIILTLQNGETIEVSVADLVSGLASQTDLDELKEEFDNYLKTVYNSTTEILTIGASEVYADETLVLNV